MPGVQSTFLAMDTEEGVEVVWNELHFADRKAFLVHEVRPAAPPPHPSPRSQPKEVLLWFSGLEPCQSPPGTQAPSPYTDGHSVFAWLE